MIARKVNVGARRIAGEIPGRLQRWWDRRRTAVLVGASAVMAIVALVWLAYEFRRLLLEPGGMAAVDLKLRLWETQAWFEGRPIYREIADAVYPPASYLMLWPLLGWMDLTAVRVVWTILTVGILACLVPLSVRFSGAATPHERRFAALLPLATYATGASVGNGQLSLAVLLCLMVSLPRLGAKRRTWSDDAGIALLVLLALVKPSMSVFFFWIVLFAAGGLRPSLLVIAGYAILSLAACFFQEGSVLELAREWMARGLRGAVWGATEGHGSIAVQDDGTLRILSVNLHSLLGALGLQEYLGIASAAVLAILGLWCWRGRKRPIWLLMAVAALVGRFCAYHGWYDDVLLLLPLLALFRVTKLDAPLPTGLRVAAGVLLASMVASLLAPGGIYALPHPWGNVYVLAQTGIWLAVLVFLIDLGRRGLPAPGAAPSP